MVEESGKRGLATSMALSVRPATTKYHWQRVRMSSDDAVQLKPAKYPRICVRYTNETGEPAAAPYKVRPSTPPP
jgi:hypothetical protein